MSRVIKTLPAFPLYDRHRNQFPMDGTLQSTPEFCKKIYGEKCKRHYASILSEGIHICPYGYSSKAFLLNGKLVYFTSIAINGMYDHQKLKSGERLPSVSLSNEMVSGAINQLRQIQEVRQSFNELKRANSFLNEAIHEIRNFNAQLKSNCERVNVIGSTDTNLEIKFRSLSQSNFAISQMTTSRLNYLSYNLNPAQAFRKTQNLYKKTDKVVRSISSLAKAKQLKISFSGSSQGDTEAFDFFELIPAVFVQNAVKYALDCSEVTVRVWSEEDHLNLYVENLGPAIEDHEHDLIFLKGYRGKNAKSTEGTGQGLYFVKKIVEVHRGKVILAVGECFELNGNRISKVAFTISVPISRP